MTSTVFLIESIPPIAENVEDRVHGANADKLNANRTDRSYKMHSLHPTIRSSRWIESAGPISRCLSP